MQMVRRDLFLVRARSPLISARAGLRSGPGILSDNRTRVGYLTPKDMRVDLMQNLQSSSNRKQRRLLA